MNIFDKILDGEIVAMQSTIHGPNGMRTLIIELVGLPIGMLLDKIPWTLNR